MAVEEDATDTIPLLVERGADLKMLLPRARERARVISKMLRNLKEDLKTEEWVTIPWSSFNELNHVSTGQSI